LNNLSKYQILATGEDEKFNFFDSHPLTPERVEEINKNSKILTVNKTVKPFASNKNEFLKELDGLLIGSNPANGFFNKNHFIHPDLEFAITFPESWKTLNIPIAAVAYEPKGEAQILLSLSEPGSSPEEQAKLFLEKYKESGTLEPRFNEPLEINGQNAYIITFQESSGGQPTIINLIWVDIGGNTLSIITAGYRPHNEKLINSAMTLQKISDDDIKDLQITVLRLEEAVEGETLKEFSLRTKNVLTVDMLSLINDIEQSKVLKKGQLLKIGKKEKYKKI
jgi:predicted Zn-dependent protease